MNTPAPAKHSYPAKKHKRILVISQTFVPDPASVGQHMADVAIALAHRGYDVRAYVSRRGYENPKMIYPARENLEGVDVRRLPLASFGKKSIFTRCIGTASFMTQVIYHQLFTPGLAGVFFSTSPPLVGMASWVVRFFRRVPVAYWAMDLNPDQLIVMGKITEKSATAKLLEWANRRILKQSALIIALDRFMAGRLLKRGDYDKKMLVMPPWSHTPVAEDIRHENNPFREKHNLQGKRVIMYSGNHSPANPLITLLQAALAFKDDDRVRFLFVGGGLGKKEVDAFIKEHNLTNMISLPYQPLEQLQYSLSAADVHLVSMGADMVGIIHPCKIYGAMSVQRPILYLGPSPSHIADILEQNKIGWQVSHGDVDAAVKAIQQVIDTPESELRQMGATASKIIAENLSQQALCNRLVDHVEAAFA